jgi:hypothetical protein
LKVDVSFSIILFIWSSFPEDEAELNNLKFGLSLMLSLLVELCQNNPLILFYMGVFYIALLYVIPPKRLLLRLAAPPLFKLPRSPVLVPPVIPPAFVLL